MFFQSVTKIVTHSRLCLYLSRNFIGLVPKMSVGRKVFEKYLFYYALTDEVPGFLLSLKSHIFTACSEDTFCIFHM